ncbi:MAG: OmpA family protein, partial [Bacteroidales bacterium]|nr:OmpA family protein [Bacteroidales bacterium]
TTDYVKELIPSWGNPSRGTPDYFNACADSIVSVPDNFAGTLQAAEGNAYIGLILRETFDPDLRRDGVSREYIQAQLLEPLKYRQLYCITLKYALSSRSPYAVDALAVALTKTKISARDKRQIIQMPQVTNMPGHLMQNKTEWAELCGVYRARGNEKYITIGNFLNDTETNFIRLYDETADSNFVYAYYYIDDVRLMPIGHEFECGCQDELSVGSDWLSENYDPKTGFNTLGFGDRNGDDHLADNYNDDNSDANNKNSDGYDNNDGADDSLNSNKNGLNNGDKNSNNTGNADDTEDIDNFDINKVGIGDAFKMSRIYFEFNSAELLSPSYDQLNSLLNLLSENPRIRIEVRGHTDNIGTKAYNRKLSIARAASVYNYLIDAGIEKSRMKYRGFGNEVPIADNDSEEGRQLNRRVEVIIVEL